MFEPQDRNVQRRAEQRPVEPVRAEEQRPVQLATSDPTAAAQHGGDGVGGTQTAGALSHWAEPVQRQPGGAADRAPQDNRQQIQAAIAKIQSLPPPRTIESNDELGRLFKEFRAANRQRTFTEGALSWLNNLAATSERVYKSIKGDPERKYWGCADASPALMSFFQQSYHGGEYCCALGAGCGAGPGEAQQEQDRKGDDSVWGSGVPAATAVKDLSPMQVSALCQAIKVEAERTQVALSTKKLACYTIAFLLGGTELQCQSAADGCLAMDWKDMSRCAFSVDGAASCSATVAEVKACTDADIAAATSAAAALSCSARMLPMLSRPEACKALYTKCPALDPESPPVMPAR